MEGLFSHPRLIDRIFCYCQHQHPFMCITTVNPKPAAQNYIYSLKINFIITLLFISLYLYLFLDRFLKWLLSFRIIYYLSVVIFRFFILSIFDLRDFIPRIFWAMQLFKGIEFESAIYFTDKISNNVSASLFCSHKSHQFVLPIFSNLVGGVVKNYFKIFFQRSPSFSNMLLMWSREAAIEAIFLETLSTQNLFCESICLNGSSFSIQKLWYLLVMKVYISNLFLSNYLLLSCFS